MEESERQVLLRATQYWRIQHPLGYCQTSDTAISWLLSIVALTVCWAFLLGANDIRHVIRKCFRYSIINNKDDPRIDAPLIGSLLLYLVMTLATAQIIRFPLMKGPIETRINFGTALGAWMVRPLPGFMVSITSVMSLNTYHANAMELQFVESLLQGVGAGYFYIDIFKKTKKAVSVLEALQAPNVTATLSASSLNSTMTSSSTSVAPTATLFQKSPDQTCGGSNKYTCFGSKWGECCSAYSFCGGDPGHCETEGCQPEYGKCNTEKKNAKRQDSESEPAVCGAESGQACWGSKRGSCCGATSVCGNDEASCGDGCQSEYGDCTNWTRVRTEFEEAALKKFRLLKGGAILGIVVFALSVLTIAAAITERVEKGSWHDGLTAWFVVLSVGRFLSGVLIWTYALKLDPNAWCLDSKTVTGLTIMWALVPLVDHFWRALFGY